MTFDVYIQMRLIEKIQYMYLRSTESSYNRINIVFLSEVQMCCVFISRECMYKYA